MLQRTGLVLSGGGARGAFQVGVWERLREDARFRDRSLVLSGTSAGAINAAMIAGGKTTVEMMAFWEGLADDLPIELAPGLLDSLLRTVAKLALVEGLHWTAAVQSWGAFVRRAVHRLPYTPARAAALLLEFLFTQRFDLVADFVDQVDTPFLVDVRRLRERLVAVVGERVPWSVHDLAISAADAETGEVVRFVSRPTALTTGAEYVVASDGLTVDMILASASIPVLFPPADVDGRRLWDGGLLVNTPLSPVVALGATEVIPVLVTEMPTKKPALDRLGIALERAVDSMLENSWRVDRTLLLERNRLAEQAGLEYQPVRLYKPIRPGPEVDLDVGAFLNFKRDVMQDLREAGREAAARWLADPDPDDRL